MGQMWGCVDGHHNPILLLFVAAIRVRFVRENRELRKLESRKSEQMFPFSFCLFVSCGAGGCLVPFVLLLMHRVRALPWSICHGVECMCARIGTRYYHCYDTRVHDPTLLLIPLEYAAVQSVLQWYTIGTRGGSVGMYWGVQIG